MTPLELEYELASETIAEIDAKISSLRQWIDHLTTWRKTLCDQLAALPSRAAGRTMEEQGRFNSARRRAQRVQRERGSAPAATRT